MSKPGIHIDDEPNPWKPKDLLGAQARQSNAAKFKENAAKMSQLDNYHVRNPPVTMRDLVEEAKAEAQAAAKMADQQAVSKKVVKDVLAEIITEEFRAVLKEQNQLIATMQEQIDELWAELRER